MEDLVEILANLGSFLVMIRFATVAKPSRRSRLNRR